jgi:hypothetical protein
MEPRVGIVSLKGAHRRTGVALTILVVLALLVVVGGTVSGGEPVDANDPVIANDPAVAADLPDVPSAASALPDCADLIPTINGECLLEEIIGGSAAGSLPVESSVSAASSVGGRRVYLTTTNFYPDLARTACNAGFHMASLWEILDTSNWVYDAGQPGAYLNPDMGDGPPSYWYGWVRTGGDSSADNVAGQGNCAVWTTRVGTSYGTSVRLSRTWESAPGDIATWDATAFACSFIGPVWCAED